MATDKNIIKNWFRNGLKPTQEQFWAWQDSYWHKSEKIPQQQIEGLDGSLANKADASQLNGKAEKDASGLTEDNVIAWKEALGVGELPSNIATVDEGEKVGNTHTKEQIEELLTLESVTTRGNYTPVDIAFNQEKTLNVGFDKVQRFTYVGDFNKQNVGIDNVIIGQLTLQNATKVSNTVAIGNEVGNGVTEGDNNVLVGTSVAKYGSKLYGSTFVGAGAGIAPGMGKPISDVRELSPVIANSRFMKKDSFGKYMFGIDLNDPSDDYIVNSGMSTIVGASYNSSSNPTTFLMSTIIGASPYFNVLFRSYNNIFIGSGNWSTYTRVQFVNSMVIGNNLDFGVGSGFRNGILAIHNDPNNFTKIDQALITGHFGERWFKVNGKINLDMSRTPNANGDDNFNKTLTINGNGTIGYEDKPKKRKLMLRNDIPVNTETPTDIEALSVYLEAGKNYFIDFHFAFDFKGYLGMQYFASFYSNELTEMYPIYEDFQVGTVAINTRESMDLYNSNSGYTYGNGFYQYSNNKDFSYKFLFNPPVNMSLKLMVKGIPMDQVRKDYLMKKGSYIEIEEII
ncbi:hypothetical protein PG303_06955 [Riemerella anatipestifer]|uniref:Uncharacterized protein n=1 Tax=Riemerella anatipestifer TaxID=34085 RepID=A0AAP6HGC4_RIEAN|nr:hypothetical protein [Riemerella anatipestifer]